MSGLVLTIRPHPGGEATVAAGREAGLTIEAAPLSEIRALAWQAPEPAKFDGLLLGSANALRHGGPALELLRDKPVYAVGEATATEAAASGFPVAMTGRGGLQALADKLSPPLRLLCLAGAEHVSVKPPAGVEIETRVVYENAPLPLPPDLARKVREGALVLLHSAAAARHFAAECDRLGVPRRAASLAALGPRIAAAAGGGWREVRSAAEPREGALLALAGQMCHEPRPR